MKSYGSGSGSLYLCSLLVLLSVLWLLKSSHCVYRRELTSLKSQKPSREKALILLLVSIFGFISNLPSYLALWMRMTLSYQGLGRHRTMCYTLYPPEVQWCWALTNAYPEACAQCSVRRQPMALCCSRAASWLWRDGSLSCRLAPVWHIWSGRIRNQGSGEGTAAGRWAWGQGRASMQLLFWMPLSWSQATCYRGRGGTVHGESDFQERLRGNVMHIGGEIRGFHSVKMKPLLFV